MGILQADIASCSFRSSCSIYILSLFICFYYTSFRQQDASSVKHRHSPLSPTLLDWPDVPLYFDISSPLETPHRSTTSTCPHFYPLTAFASSRLHRQYIPEHQSRAVRTYLGPNPRIAMNGPVRDHPPGSVIIFRPPPPHAPLASTAFHSWTLIMETLENLAAYPAPHLPTPSNRHRLRLTHLPRTQNSRLLPPSHHIVYMHFLWSVSAFPFPTE